MDDELELDLSKYIMTLFRQWRLILTCALVPTLLAGMLSLVLPKSYKASVLVASAMTLTPVYLGFSIETTTEEQFAAQSQQAQALYDRQARLQSYVELANTGTVAAAVLAELGDRLPPEDRSEARLLSMVEAELVSDSDAISISVTASDPILAADIANTWGQAYVAHINAIYSGTPVGGSYEDIHQQVETVRGDYEAAQAAVVAFRDSNSIDENQHKIDQLQVYLSNYYDQYKNYIGKYYEERASFLNQYYTDRLTQLQLAYDESQRMSVLLEKTLLMRDQVQDGGMQAVRSNAMALMLLKNEVFTAFPPQLASQVPLGDDLQLQLQQPQAGLLEGLIVQLQQPQAGLLEGLIGLGVTQDQVISDLDALAGVLAERQSELSGEIVSLQGEPPDSRASLLAAQSDTTVEIPQTLPKVEQQIRSLQAQIVEAQGKLQQLTQTRDLAWSAFSNLSTKEAELRVAEQTGSVQVSFASKAAVLEGDTFNGMRITLIAGVVGLLLGILAAFAVEFWQTRNGQEPYAIRFPWEKARAEE